MIASEVVTGIIGDSLPGGVEIHYGPGPAIGKPKTKPTHVPVPSVGYSAGATATDSRYLPGGVFKEDPTSTEKSTPTITPTPSEPPVPEGYEVIRTDYITDGNTVSKIVVIETVEYVMMSTETATVTATASGQKARRQMLHLHRHRRGSH